MMGDTDTRRVHGKRLVDGADGGAIVEAAFALVDAVLLLFRGKEECIL